MKISKDRVKESPSDASAEYYYKFLPDYKKLVDSLASANETRDDDCIGVQWIS